MSEPQIKFKTLLQETSFEQVSPLIHFTELSVRIVQLKKQLFSIFMSLVRPIPGV